MAPRNARADETPRLSHIEKLKPGDDPTDAINRLYSIGRRTYGQPMPDAPRERQNIKRRSRIGHPSARLMPSAAIRR
jgi:hypothetical protein